MRRICHLGLSISPERLLGMPMSMESRAIDVFEREGVVCPLNVRHGLFTTAATDNLDINPSSATAMTSFHRAYATSLMGEGFMGGCIPPLYDLF